ncbi:hypothetical protein RLK51_09310 [Streptococcus pneumoniae]|uniref:Uncharacterized protein n=1 Tax=Streptococcus pneumoniae TaxID=1313 RepID=A0AAJ5P4Y6_STREE|nr:hypothetical protein [Streptococcus pneumoniae]MDS3171763.1 hypothetical protein [Streptococcus pneumoniae]MDS4771547.1 hypothetical protein [Streptococcus pneumoniae]MDS5336183.1 hypothetical protein [Streptococcus pneumoniae]MDS5925274.1 hypothetical protein [Streptococcus pneumoniae]
MPANTKVIFQETFADFQNYYVLIGGTATSIVLDSQGFKSRTTKDYDMVIIDEVKNKEFYTTLNHFLELGEYQGSQKDEKAQLFRFTTTNPEFPSMIELFSILPEYTLKKDGREIPLHFDQDASLSALLIPLHFDQDASLSALLLDEDYYNILVHEKETIQGYSVLSNCGLYSSKISSNHVSFHLQPQNSVLSSLQLAS